MKKFLIILMVLAMASVLFVGCTTPPTPEPEPEPEPTPTPTVKTETPYITGVGSGLAAVSLSSTATQYSNSPTTSGVAVAGAIIKLYVDDVQVGVANSGSTGSYEAGVTMVDLTEGVSVLYTTATQPGLAESDPSDKITFTYDETAPAIASVAGDSSACTIKVTFDGDVETYDSTSNKYETSALNPLNYTWYNGSTETALTEDNCTISKVSDKLVTITPSSPVVPTAGVACYITLDYTAATVVVSTNTYNITVYDKAGNCNALAVSTAFTTVP